MKAPEAKSRLPDSVALVAHDKKKDELIEWVKSHERLLANSRLFGTGTTGGRIADETGLEITRLKSGPLGGDAQIGAMIAEGRLDALIFFIDPLSPLPHDVDVKALTRLATVYDLPMACSRSTADLIVAGLLS